MSIRWALLIGIVSFASGCATIIDGTTQTVSFHSNPEGATVRVNGTTLGVTPLAFDLKKSKYNQVTFSKDGYKTLELPLESHLDGWFWGNIVFGGLVGSTTDGVSGAVNEYSPGQYMVSLEPTIANNLDRETLKASDQKAREFIVLAYNNIMSDLAQGKGQYLHTLLGVLEIPDEKSAAAVKKLRALSEVYTNILEFADHAIELYLKPKPAEPEKPATVVAPAATPNSPASELYAQLLKKYKAGDDAVRAWVVDLSGVDANRLEKFIRTEKGSSDDAALTYHLMSSLPADEVDAARWYMQTISLYHPE